LNSCCWSAPAARVVAASLRQSNATQPSVRPWAAPRSSARGRHSSSRRSRHHPPSCAAT
jgi:hypothetical protein